MLNHYNSIYLSPHLDDVVLSCGGRISQQTEAKQSVLIVTVTAGDPPGRPLPPFAQSHHDAWQLSQDVVQDRRAEDVAACTVLGAHWLHWDFGDAIYRRAPETGEALYNNDDQLFGAINSAETPLIKQLITLLQSLPPADEIVCPLAVGDHVDHQLTRVSAEAAFGSGMTYYEDYPYVQRHGLGGKTDAGMWADTTTTLSTVHLDQKVRAFAAYESQIGHLFDSMQDMQDKLRTFSAETGGERYWYMRPEQIRSA